MKTVDEKKIIKYQTEYRLYNNKTPMWTIFYK